MSIQLPTKEQDLEIVKNEVKAIAALLEQQDSINEAIKARSKSVEESVEGMKASDVKKLAKALFLSNATELREDAEALESAVNGLSEED